MIVDTQSSDARKIKFRFPVTIGAADICWNETKHFCVLIMAKWT